MEVEPLKTNATSVRENPGDVPTLSALLAEVDEARARGAERVSLTTDPVDGHPTSIEIDYHVSAIDDEACYEISEYSVAPGST